MDDDPVLRSLADDLERDDPQLAALLDGRSGERHHAAAWAMAALVLLALPLLLPLNTVLGLLALLIVIGAPLAVSWLID